MSKELLVSIFYHNDSQVTKHVVFMYSSIQLICDEQEKS